jgi:hypothetical protein
MINIIIDLTDYLRASAWLEYADDGKSKKSKSVIKKN